MHSIPFSDASLSEVLTRVAFRMIERDYRRNPSHYGIPEQGIYRMRMTYLYGKFDVLDTWCLAYQCYVSKGMRLKLIKSMHIERSRFGLPWRSSIYFDYKASRRHDPRITNRGVTVRSRKQVGE